MRNFKIALSTEEIISEEELLKQIFGIISIFKSNGLSDWINFYMEILGRLAPGLPG